MVYDTVTRVLDLAIDQNSKYYKKQLFGNWVCIRSWVRVGSLLLWWAP
jgi:hypothetical protein